MSLTDKYKFLSFFAAPTQLQENTSPLTHNLPPLTLRPSPQLLSLLSKIRDCLVVVSSLGFSPSFFTLVRKILMLQQIPSQQSPRRISACPIHELHFYNKIQIGLAQPLEWIYTQLRLKLHSKLQIQSPIKLNQDQDVETKKEALETILSMNLFMCSVLIYEVSEERHITEIIKILAYFQQKTNNLTHPIFPQIFMVYDCQFLSQEAIQKQLSQWTDKGVVFQFLQKLNTQEMNWNDQHKLINHSKRIKATFKTKLINQIPLTSKMLAKFIHKFIQNNQQNDQTILSAWQKAQISQAEQLAEGALNQYICKIDEMTQGNSILSINFLHQIQTKIRNDIIKQVSEKLIKSGVRQQVVRTQRRLLQYKQQLQQKNKQSILSWGRDFLKETYSTLEKKIGKDIKSIPTYKQEMLLFIDFFRKKSQPFIHLQLALLFNQFAINKIFQSCQQISSLLVSPLQEQLKTLESQLAALTVQNKQLRKKNSKQESQIARKYNEIKQKNTLLETRCELLEKTSELLKTELTQTKQKYEDKINQINQKQYLQIKNLRQQCETLRETEEQLTKKYTILQFELAKQKLLHQQTTTYYEELIGNYKDKQEQFKQEIIEISMNSSRQLNLLKQSSHRETEDYNLSRQQINNRITELEQIIKQRDSELQQKNSQIQSIRISATQKTDSLQNKIAELSLRNRLLSQKEMECDILKNKLRKNEDQIKRLFRQKDQQLELCKEAQKQNLITQQKCQYIQETLAAEKTKYKEVLQSYQKLKMEKEELQQKVSSQQKKIMADEWVQVEDITQKQKLKMALQIIRELQIEYNRMKAQIQWSRRSKEYKL